MSRKKPKQNKFNKAKKYKILALIPARGGSKGIPRKNIRLLAGKPLIAYTIEAAKKCKYLDRVIVSTEDKEIAEISKKYGAEVIERPKIWATDKAKFVDAIPHLLEVLQKEKWTPEIIVELQPTSPLRTVDDLNKAIELFLKNGCGPVVVSVCEPSHPLQWSFREKGKYLEPVFGWKYFKGIMRQDVQKIYIPNGAIFISTPKDLYSNKGFYSKKILPYIMPAERSIDIDNEIDLELAELIIKKH